MKRSAGFTLIELVVVIVLLGILAAVAVPKFTDLSGDARQAAVNGVAGSLTSGSTSNYASYVTKSSSSASWTPTAGAAPYAVTTATGCTAALANNLVSGVTFTATPNGNNEFSIAVNGTSTCTAGNPLSCTITTAQGGKTATANVMCTG